jgi:hypothetical protein
MVLKLCISSLKTAMLQAFCHEEKKFLVATSYLFITYKCCKNFLASLSWNQAQIRKENSENEKEKEPLISVSRAFLVENRN